MRVDALFYCFIEAFMVSGLIAIGLAVCFVKYRVKIVETVGKIEWAEKYLGMGGTYNLMIILAVLLFIWGVASMTGTTGIFLSPLKGIIRVPGR